ncbi:MAG TPA: hypothetical protein VKK61_00595, partial [Tepidisphaeraceae bacterium]|nr:hypothetical protein [Tepidisphaeraceae bacterium]
MLRVKIGVLLLLAALMATLVMLHTHGVTGPSFWGWTYRTLPAIPIYLGIALSAIPFFIGLWLDHQRQSLRWAGIVLIMFSSFAMRIAAIAYRPDASGIDRPNLEMIRISDENPDVMSYYVDAAALSKIPLRQWMPAYGELMWQFHLHAKTKPPGPILYWLALIKMLGINGTTALLGGLGIAVLSVAAIPATYFLINQLTRDSDAAMFGSAFLALCPGFVLFFPMFDQSYILLSCALIAFWFAALRKD